MNIMNMECQKCKWWFDAYREGHGNATGECRRYPPVLVILATDRKDPMWDVPRTLDTDFCGEWTAID